MPLEAVWALRDGTFELAEGVKMFNTMQEHAAANHAQSVKLWSEMAPLNGT